MAFTDSTHYASFSRKGANVAVPFLPGGNAVSIYRVVVKLVWYRANGNVLGTATDRVQRYDDFTTPYHNQSEGWCSDYFQ